MDLAALEDFIVAAKRASYVGDGERAEPSRVGGVEHFRGRECIEVGGVEAYALDYFGGLVKP